MLTPEELVLRAVNRQISYLAITDHDTIDAIEQAKKTANNYPITIINGVEISAYYQGFDVHILALNFDDKDEKLHLFLEKQKKIRLERILMMNDKLIGIGIGDILSKINVDSYCSITRSHIARKIVELGKASSIKQAFAKYLAKGKVAYVQADWSHMSSVVELIKAIKGISVLAHPTKYNLSNTKMMKMLVDFKSYGGEAIEAIMSNQKPLQRQWLLDCARQYDLKVSAGSDFHRIEKWNDIGKNLQVETDRMIDYSVIQ